MAPHHAFLFDAPVRYVLGGGALASAIWAFGFAAKDPEPIVHAEEFDAKGKKKVIVTPRPDPAGPHGRRDGGRLPERLQRPSGARAARARRAPRRGAFIVCEGWAVVITVHVLTHSLANLSAHSAHPRRVEPSGREPLEGSRLRPHYLRLVVAIGITGCCAFRSGPSRPSRARRSPPRGPTRRRAPGRAPSRVLALAHPHPVAGAHEVGHRRLQRRP